MEHQIENNHSNSPEEKQAFPYELIDTTDLSDKRLCCFLSDIFLDTETDYKKIACIAKHFPLEHVENMLFKWVAPVCYVNLMSVIPEVWLRFDCDELWENIQRKLEKEKKANFFEKFNIFIRDKYIRNRFNYAWLDLQAAILKLADDVK